jgi:hypothetical protein
MGKSMRRHRSQSAGANVIPHPHADPHGPAFANTRPLALVDKHSRGKDSAYPYPHHLSNVQPAQRQSHPEHRPHFDAQAHPQRHPQSQPMPRSILRVRERTSDLDRESPPAIAESGMATSFYRKSAANQGIHPSPSSQPSADSRSRIPILNSAGQIQNPPRFGYEHEDCSMSSVLGRGVGIGVEMKMGIGMGAGRGCGGDVGMGVGGDGRHSQPVLASEFSGASGSKMGGIRTSGEPGVRLNLPNPHPQVEDDSECDSGIFFLLFVVSAFD